MNIFNEIEFASLCKKFNKKKPYIKEVTLTDITEGYFNKVAGSVESDRRGEVAFCVVRPNGKVIIVTCSEYPEGIYRIPTGGVGYDENIIEAVYREAKEELGLDTEITDFLGVLKIKFRHGNEAVMFYSYLFILKEIGGRLLLDASDDEVSEVREVDAEELAEAVDKLKAIEGMWHDWGMFRYETSRAILEYLRNSPGA
ncbi:MAG: NUDIX hydrolase [Clostridiales bacterium]|jgi:ADP-ribose pyrophosphatase YjhB (NUDIX family)|nr:NUDIX hydrolase [Eubacteriales bacterium]MDH7567105.1 NUDIX hydrolase [Clostridiales bacterium]